MKEMGGGEERPADQKNKCLTHISRSTAGCGHDTACSFDLRQSKVTDHNFGVFVHAVIQQVLRLQIQEEWSKEDGLQTGRKGKLLYFCFPQAMIPSSLCGRSPYRGDIWLHPRSGGWVGWHLSLCRNLSPQSCQTAHLQIPCQVKMKNENS